LHCCSKFIVLRSCFGPTFIAYTRFTRFEVGIFRTWTFCFFFDLSCLSESLHSLSMISSLLSEIICYPEIPGALSLFWSKIRSSTSATSLHRNRSLIFTSCIIFATGNGTRFIATITRRSAARSSSLNFGKLHASALINDVLCCDLAKLHSVWGCGARNAHCLCHVAKHGCCEWEY